MRDERNAAELRKLKQEMQKKNADAKKRMDDEKKKADKMKNQNKINNAKATEENALKLCDRSTKK